MNRSSLRAVPTEAGPRVRELFAELLTLAPLLGGPDALEAVGETAKVGALLAARVCTPPVAASTREPEGGLLDAPAVARLLGVKCAAVYRWARSGELKSFRPGAGTVRFDPADVESFKKARSRL
jgi:excisionase family DNA binding protein